MSLFTELKRRNVFRVGIAYAVAAWVLLQVFDVIGEILELPAWGGKLILAMLVVGFFLALILAWAYELTPEGVKRESEVDRSQSVTRQTGRKLNALIMGLLVLAVAYLLFDKFWLQSRLAATIAEPSPPAVADETLAAASGGPDAIDPHSIAVLPFDNRSPLAEDEFFIEGIHDDLLTTLARIGSLKVISRTSVSRFAQSEKSIPEIARELGVAAIMEGAVQRAGDTVRVNVQLIDARTDQHLWAEFFDRELTTDNLFAIQSEITQRIARALEAELSPDEQRGLQNRPTENLAAYSAYLRGLRAFETREVEPMREALADFQRAVELDPEFALAWSGIAQVAEVLPSWGGMTREEGKAISVPAAERAMALAPDSGEANLALAMVLEDDRAVPQYAKAVQMLPNHAMAHQWYANALQGPPGPEWLQALDLLRKAEELDPLSPHIRAQVARQLIFMGRFDEAEAQLRVVLASHPDFAPAKGFMSWLMVGRGDLDQSIVWARSYLAEDPGVDFPKLGWAMSLLHLQDRERLLALAQAAADEDPDAPLVDLANRFVALLDRRYDAVVELAGGAVPRRGGPIDLDVEFEIAFANTYAADYPAAFQAWQKAVPGFFEESERARAMRTTPDLACVVADVARRVGEVEFGDTLAREAVRFATEELPRYLEHAAHRANVAYCLAYQGDLDGAVEQLEINLRHRHYDFWWEPRRLELFAPLWGDPRFETVMQAFEDEMARQRASLDRMDAETGGATGP